MEISVKQMMAIENKGHDMGFLKKFMMENAGAAAVKRLVERFGDVSSKKILVYAGLGNNGVCNGGSAPSCWIRCKNCIILLGD